jgi:hypothetical protein
MKFITHKGEVVTGKRLERAFSSVADFWASNARAVRREDAYANHVTEETKEEILQRQLERSNNIRNMTEPMGFWLWQRINEQLTGKCVALFSHEVTK